ncbi:MAG: Maf family protein [Spirochaetia bacterium]|nr:Maf family protein [Spirochaetia bacterium]MCF7940161.1 Maf family protein [Spirochaetia bacterium]
MSSPVIILASQSPARCALLRSAGCEVIVEPTFGEELVRHSDPAACVLDIAQQKMDWYLEHQGPPSFPVLTADTLLSFEQSFIGKVRTVSQAHAMLRRLSGATHTVHSAAVLYDSRTQVRTTVADHASVTFHELSDDEIAAYLETEEWVGAAGCYRIQHQGIRLISSIEGDYFTIVGLPLIGIFGIVREQSI